MSTMDGSRAEFLKSIERARSELYIGVRLARQGLASGIDETDLLFALNNGTRMQLGREALDVMFGLAVIELARSITNDPVPWFDESREDGR